MSVNSGHFGAQNDPCIVERVDLLLRRISDGPVDAG